MVTNANNKLLHIWTSKIVFSWIWWLEIGLSFLPWILWIKLRDKNDTVRLLFVGLIAVIVTSFFDNLGMSYGLWYYAWKPFPFIPSFFPWNYTCFPVEVMLFLQLKPRLNAFLKSVGFAFINAFIFEPIAIWVGMYTPVHWKNWYSFLLYIPLYLIFDNIYKSKIFDLPSN